MIQISNDILDIDNDLYYFLNTRLPAPADSVLPPPVQYVQLIIYELPNLQYKIFLL